MSVINACCIIRMTKKTLLAEYLRTVAVLHSLLRTPFFDCIDGVAFAVAVT